MENSHNFSPTFILLFSHNTVSSRHTKTGPSSSSSSRNEHMLVIFVGFWGFCSLSLSLLSSKTATGASCMCTPYFIHSIHYKKNTSERRNRVGILKSGNDELAALWKHNFSTLETWPGIRHSSQHQTPVCSLVCHGETDAWANLNVYDSPKRIRRRARNFTNILHIHCVLAALVCFGVRRGGLLLLLRLTVFSINENIHILYVRLLFPLLFLPAQLLPLSSS